MLNFPSISLQILIFLLLFIEGGEYKKENIKLQNKCEVDWGNNLVSKKERKLFRIKRKEIMKRENKLIDEKYENNLINKSFIENTNKLHFKLGFMTPSLKNLKLTLNNN